ncbi:MAG: DUF2807 domain-containing protein, partial [Bacteroidales bacterium]|nr:DUF2807 domain-containing protein [Bacteroidales bacterium]
MNKLLILAAVAVATISSCSFIERDFEKFAEKKEAEEAEKIAHKTLEVDSFKHIYTEFVYADVEYSQADTTKVEIDYTTDMLSSLNIYVQNDTLYILNPKVVDGMWSYAEDWKVKVRCSSKEIKSMHYDIELGDVTVKTAIDTDSLDIFCSSSRGCIVNFEQHANIGYLNLYSQHRSRIFMFGDIESADIESYSEDYIRLIGKIGRANINIVDNGIIGEGIINAAMLSVDDLKISIGSENIRRHKIGTVNNTLDVTLAGNAEFSYQGNPKIINQEIAETAKLINE